MLTRIDIAVVENGSPLAMDVVVPKSTTKFLVTDVVGLGPVKADISTSTLSLLDGDNIDTSRVGKRNIVINFDYTPQFALGQTAESLRKELYAIARPSSTVYLTFVLSDGSTRRISGQVESINSPMFTKDLQGQISIICPIPYFKGVQGSATGTSHTPLYITYDGEVPVGVTMSYKVPTTLKSIVFSRSHPVPGWQALSATIASTTVLPANSDYWVSTRDRDKYAKSFSGTNVIPFLTVFNWWKLYPGTNIVSVAPVGHNDTNPATPFDIQWDVLYGGL